MDCIKVSHSDVQVLVAEHKIGACPKNNNISQMINKVKPSMFNFAGGTVF